MQRKIKVLVVEPNELPKEEMIETLMSLRNAIDCFDLDEADNAMHKLEGYVFTEDYRSKVEQLSIFVAAESNYLSAP